MDAKEFKGGDNYDRQTDRQTGYPSLDKPWLKYYSEEAIANTVPECSIYEYLNQNNKDYLSDIAIIYLGRKITYKELFENIDKTAAAFLNIGVKEKEIVTVALPSTPEAVYCVYALNKIGAVANMIHPLAGKEETCFYLNEAKSRIAVIFDGAYKDIAEEIASTSVDKVVVVSPSDSAALPIKAIYNLKVKKVKYDNTTFLSWKSFIRNGAGITVNTVKRDCHEMAIISHTGGTTGEPKGCMISAYNIVSEIWQIGKTMFPKRQECMMAVLPPFVNYSLTNGMLEPLSFGMKLLLIPKYEPLKFAKYVEKYKVNHVNTIPAYCEALLQIPNIEKYDLSSLGFVVYGGEGMTKETESEINEVLAKCGCKYSLKKGLGMTEVTSAASATFDCVNDLESVGIPLPKMIMKAVDPETYEEQHYGEDGEICITGPTLMLGYYNKPDETDELIRRHADGRCWIHTGDLGYVTQDGVVYVTGRIKRIIMTKGRDGQVTKMFPERIEKAIYSNQAVEQCCVIGVPDKDRINCPKAFVVKKKDVIETVTEEEILKSIRVMLPEYMIPEKIKFVSELPRTPRGKVDYRALEKYENEKRKKQEKLVEIGHKNIETSEDDIKANPA